MLSASLVSQKIPVSKIGKKKKKTEHINKNRNINKTCKKDSFVENNSKDYTKVNQIINYSGGELWKNSTLLMGNIR